MPELKLPGFDEFPKYIDTGLKKNKTEPGVIETEYELVSFSKMEIISYRVYTKEPALAYKETVLYSGFDWIEANKTYNELLRAGNYPYYEYTNRVVSRICNCKKQHKMIECILQWVPEEIRLVMHYALSKVAIPGPIYRNALTKHPEYFTLKQEKHV